MGIFDKIKANITHGGVKVSLVSNGQVPRQGNYPFSVIVTAKDSPQSVNKITARITYRDQRESGSGGYRATRSNEPAQERLVAQVENTQPFTLAAGESREIPMVIGVNAPSLETGGTLGSMLGFAGAAFQRAGAVYMLRAEADVEGIMLDPGETQYIQIV